MERAKTYSRACIVVGLFWCALGYFTNDTTAMAVANVWVAASMIITARGIGD